MTRSSKSVSSPRWRAAACLILALPAFPCVAGGGVVSDWNATTEAVLVSSGGSPGTDYAMVHAAIYDAVNAIDRHHEVFAVRPATNPDGASPEAAATAAAYRVLLALYPRERARLDAAYAASLASVPEGTAKAKGVIIGTEVATAWLAYRAGDGREATVRYVFRDGPGQYQRTPPDFLEPMTAWAATMRPFTLSRPSQFRAEGPPDLTSYRYAQDLNATQSLGDIRSATRTVQQTEIGRFHTEGPATFWARNIRDFAAGQHLDIAAEARLFALVFVAFADASIACWDSKRHYNRWRPVTAIALADTVGNPATDADADWQPLAATPADPEYPAAHGCVAGAIVEALNAFFQTRRLAITLTSTVAGSIPHVFANTDEILDEVLVARVYGGSEFPASVAHGLKLGRTVGRWVDSTRFRPIERDR